MSGCTALWVSPYRYEEELTSGLVSIDGLRLDRGMWMGSDANCFVSVAKILNYTLYDLHTTYSKYINNELAA